MAATSSDQGSVAPLNTTPSSALDPAVASASASETANETANDTATDTEPAHPEGLPAYSLHDISPNTDRNAAAEPISEKVDPNAQPAADPVVADDDARFAVWWSEPENEDPENPMNWTDKRKWGIIGTLSFLTFLTPLASSMLAPGVPLILEEFNVTNDTQATFVVSIFVLGFAFGPLVIAPVSEIYGRMVVYHVCNSLFVVFTILCAIAKDMGALLAFRFLAGFAGVAVITCGGGSIADLMPTDKRGGAMAIWSLGPLLGPVIGPAAAGFLVEAKGWRWVFWVIAIAGGCATFASFFILPETYAPALLNKKAAKLRKETGDERYHSRLDTGETQKQVFKAAIIRPAKMLLRSPVVAALCSYIAVIYGLLYILFTTFTFVYREHYGFSADGAGLSFLAPGIGNLFGVAFSGVLSDRIVKRIEAQGRTPRPEDRLHPLLTIPASLFLPLGLIMYGWTADKHVHWIAPMIGTAIMGFGMIGIMMCVQTYLVDTFPLHAASVMAANSVLRSVLGAVLPLCALQLYDAIGLGWGNTLLGLIALALAPTLWVFGLYGERLRTNPKFQVKL